MVDQDKSHLHGRHVSENPLTPTASSPPHLSQTPFYSQVTYSTEKKGKKMEYEHIQKPTHIIFFFFSPKLSTAHSFCCWSCPRSQAVVHFCDGQGISTIKPSVYSIWKGGGEAKKETSLWFNENEASCLMHICKWILPLCFLSVRICLNSTIFSVNIKK